MNPEEFRKHGHEVVDWIADYFTRIESYPVLSQLKPGEIRASLPAEAPAQPESFEAILADVEKLIVPGITHWQSPNFFGYFPCNASGPAILGDLLSSGFGVQGMLWATSPACTELETHVLDWLVGAMGLPEKFHSSSTGGGVIQDTASSATFCAVLAARERATSFESNGSGVSAKADRVHLNPGPLLDREGNSDRWHRQGESASDRSGRSFRNASEALAAAIARDKSCRD